MSTLDYNPRFNPSFPVPHAVATSLPMLNLDRTSGQHEAAAEKPPSSEKVQLNRDSTTSVRILIHP
jgi:hypothetical protein